MLAEYFTDTMTENAAKLAVEYLAELEVSFVYADYYGYPEDIVALSEAVEHIKETYSLMSVQYIGRVLIIL